MSLGDAVTFLKRLQTEQISQQKRHAAVMTSKECKEFIARLVTNQFHKKDAKLVAALKNDQSDPVVLVSSEKEEFTISKNLIPI
jgi:hypothetical protein